MSADAASTRPDFYWATVRLRRGVHPAVHARCGFGREAVQPVSTPDRLPDPVRRRRALDQWQAELALWLFRAPVIAGSLELGAVMSDRRLMTSRPRPLYSLPPQSPRRFEEIAARLRKSTGLPEKPTGRVAHD